ncbi:MAG: cysteine--tRNA ligase [Pseudomonadota bacterium]
MQIYDSLTQENQELALDKPISIYTCGPTVYDRIHIGNARVDVVYDTLVRYLKIHNANITYIKNITDIDDKIIQAAIKQKQSIKTVTTKNIEYYHQDLKYLNCLNPSYQPKVSETIPEIIDIIKILLNKKYAYADKNNNIYFDVKKYPEYYQLSKRSSENNLNKANNDKKSPEDFALWKINNKNDLYGFESPWGFGRPGWHIECSAMSHKHTKHLNIHGGGLDLLFPHHTNERAQSCCAFNKKKYADIWMHTGLVNINNSKMSKSLNNFITVEQIRKQKTNGEIIRLLLLSGHYQKPLNYSEKRLNEITNLYKNMLNFYKKYKLEQINIFNKIQQNNDKQNFTIQDIKTDKSNEHNSLNGIEDIPHEFNQKNIFTESESNKVLLNNFNIPNLLVRNIKIMQNPCEKSLIEFKYNLYILGIEFNNEYLNNVESSIENTEKTQDDIEKINKLISQRQIAKNNKNYELADQIKKSLQEKYNIQLIDQKDGKTIFKPK